MKRKIFFLAATLFVTLGMLTTSGFTQTFPNNVVDNTADDQAEPAIAIHPLDPLRLVAGANSGTRTSPYVSSVKAYYSSDGGNSWSIKTNLPKPIHNAAADPSASFDRNGNWFYGYITYYLNPVTGGGPDSGTVFVGKSTNNGTSWTATQVDPNKVAVDFEDKPYIALDNTGKDYNGRVYVSWTYLPDPIGSASQIKFAYSTNQAQNFSAPILLDTATGGGPGEITAATVAAPPDAGSNTLVQGSVPAVGPNGEIYVIWVRLSSAGQGATGTIQVRKSTNGGVSFNSAVAAAQVSNARTRLGGLDIRSYANATIAVDQNTGYVYIAWTEYKPGTPVDLDVYYVYSTSGGTYWSSPQRATEESTPSLWQFFPWLSVDPTGKVYLVYLRRADQSTNNVDVYVAESTDNGVTFSTPNLRITSVSSNASNALWGHHYQGITSMVGYAYPIWTDYRNGNADIFASRANRPPTSDTLIATAYNSGRRLVRTSNGDLHLAYPSNEEIYYAKSIDGGTTWTDHTRLSTGNGKMAFPRLWPPARNGSSSGSDMPVWWVASTVMKSG